MAKILVIDDERAIRNSLKDILSYENHTVEDASDGLAGLELIKQNKYDLVLSDIKMPGLDGLELLQKLEDIEPHPTVVMISGHGNIETAVESIKRGAFDFIPKPLDLNRLLVTVRNALDKEKLVSETKTLKKKVGGKYNMMGESLALKQVRDMIEKLAPTDARVLILGPNGCGKELVAREIHEKSLRSAGPFVEVNCAAIPSELIESELFGHEKGAFTSAIKQKKGNFEQAEGGTLFLDEIGDMSLSAQAKVLRALQENKIMRVGGEKEIQVNVRVLAATNKNLQEEIAKGNFREDLYHRLSVIVVKVPSLNERREDIPLLVAYFSQLICKDYGMAVKNFDKEALDQLQQRNWTGNIRELRNIVERLIILGGAQISGKEVGMYV
jgi:two-component system, NtrC family, nitrogen regulation response regulator NtrX